MTVKIKIGLDVHGVIDTNPHFFAHLSYMLRTEGHDVHIVTGRELCDELLNKLKQHNVGYTKIFSITSYHKDIGTHIVYKDDDPTQPMLAPPKWDRSKADYAKRAGLHFYIDNSLIYGQYFTDIATQYLLYTPELQEFLFQLTGWSNRFTGQLSKLPGLYINKGVVNL